MRQFSITIVWLVAGSVFALMPLCAAAQSFDGAYDGTISCGLLTDAKRVWESPFRMIVDNGEARYERPILRDGQPTGVDERGGGHVTADGEVVLSGRANGAHYVFDARYHGHLTQKDASLDGEQLWYMSDRGAASRRSCRIDLLRVSPSS